MCDEVDLNTLKSDYDNIYINSQPENTIHEYILRKVSEHVARGRQEWLTDARFEMTYKFSDVEKISSKFAKALRKIGLERGETVIFCSHDCSLLYLLILGIWRANGTVRSVFGEENIDTILDKIEESGSKFIICDSGIAEKLRDEVLSIPWEVDILVFGNIDKCIPISRLLHEDHELIDLPDEVDGSDIALILPTSGTSGSCKAVVLTHETLLKTINKFEAFPFCDDPEKACILFGKPTHATGMYALFQLAFGQRVITSPYSEENLFQLIEQFGASSLFCVAPLLKPLVESPLAKEYDLSSLEYIISGGSYLSSDFIQKLYYEIPSIKTVINYLGMTECFLLTCAVNMNFNKTVDLLEDYPPGSIGKLVPSTELQVRDIETKRVLGPFERGELCFKSDIAFSFYLFNSEDTESTLVDGWIISGDYGYVDSDGFVFITDRIQDTFFSSTTGNHISPSDIERVLRGHHAVDEAVVISEPFGNIGNPRAFITVRREFEDKENSLELEIKQYADDHLSSDQALIGGFFLLSSLPLGKSGKFARRLLSKPKRTIINRNNQDSDN